MSCSCVHMIYPQVLLVQICFSLLYCAITKNIHLRYQQVIFDWCGLCGEEKKTKYWTLRHKGIDRWCVRWLSDRTRVMDNSPSKLEVLQESPWISVWQIVHYAIPCQQLHVWCIPLHLCRGTHAFHVWSRMVSRSAVLRFGLKPNCLFEISLLLSR